MLEVEDGDFIVTPDANSSSTGIAVGVLPIGKSIDILFISLSIRMLVGRKSPPTVTPVTKSVK